MISVFSVTKHKLCYVVTKHKLCYVMLHFFQTYKVIRIMRYVAKQLTMTILQGPSVTLNT